MANTHLGSDHFAADHFASNHFRATVGATGGGFHFGADHFAADHFVSNHFREGIPVVPSGGGFHFGVDHFAVDYFVSNHFREGVAPQPPALPGRPRQPIGGGGRVQSVNRRRVKCVDERDLLDMAMMLVISGYLRK